MANRRYQVPSCEDKLIQLQDAVKKFLEESGWTLFGCDAYAVTLLRHDELPYHCGLNTFKNLEKSLSHSMCDEEQ